MSTKLLKIVEKIAKIHDFDLSVSVGHLRIINPPYEDLVIEKHGSSTIGIAHLLAEGGTSLAVRISYPSGLPMSVKHFHYLPGKANTADGHRFLEQWADNLKWQGFAETGLESYSWAFSGIPLLLLDDGKVLEVTSFGKEPNLKFLQTAVDGLIECVYLHDDHARVYGNEEGKFFFGENDTMTRISMLDLRGDYFAGPAYIYREGENG
jgi:hypothetical protein